MIKRPERIALRCARSASFYHLSRPFHISFPMDVFGTAMAFMMLGAGAFLTVRTGFFQFTHFGSALLSPFRKGGDGSGVSPFGAMATALGSSVGTANIAGVAGALAIGGAGAVFWMWLAGLLGMATKLTETALAMKYRRRSGAGYAGGPMYYMERGLPLIGRRLALIFSAAGCGAALVGTALVQSNTAAEAVCGLLTLRGAVGAKLIAGLAAALLTGAVILGGARRIASFSEAAVPVMAGAYIAAACTVIITHRAAIMPVLKEIVGSAFGIKQAAGGGVYGMALAMRVGVARGVYSNEAGVGSAPMAHANSSETDPVRQGLMGVFEVFVDTAVMCSLTALAILTSGAPLREGLFSAEAAFASIFGARGGAVFVAVSSVLFAFTSLVGWELYGEVCLKYLTGGRFKLAYRLVFLSLIPVGALAAPGLAWRLGELFNYMMALPNVISLILLSGAAAELIRQYKMFEKSPRRHYNKG